MVNVSTKIEKTITPSEDRDEVYTEFFKSDENYEKYEEYFPREEYIEKMIKIRNEEMGLQKIEDPRKRLRAEFALNKRSLHGQRIYNLFY